MIVMGACSSRPQMKTIVVLVACLHVPLLDSAFASWLSSFMSCYCICFLVIMISVSMLAQAVVVVARAGRCRRVPLEVFPWVDRNDHSYVVGGYHHAPQSEW